MCRFCLQCPQDKSDSEGGASPTAPENHLGGCRVTGPALRSWGLSRVLPHPWSPTPAALGSVGCMGAPGKGCLGVLSVIGMPHTLGTVFSYSQFWRVTGGCTEVPREPGVWRKQIVGRSPRSASLTLDRSRAMCQPGVGCIVSP